MAKIDSFIAGLDMLRQHITGVCFYNSSGGDADFILDRELTLEEQATLARLGFYYYNKSLSFSEWYNA